VIVVTGHQRERVEAALAGLPVEFAHNADFADGLGTRFGPASARCRRSRTASSFASATCRSRCRMIDRLVGALAPDRERSLPCRASTASAQSGRLVAPIFAELTAVEGDVVRAT